MVGTVATCAANGPTIGNTIVAGETGKCGTIGVVAGLFEIRNHILAGIITGVIVACEAILVLGIVFRLSHFVRICRPAN